MWGSNDGLGESAISSLHGKEGRPTQRLQAHALRAALSRGPFAVLSGGLEV